MHLTEDDSVRLLSSSSTIPAPASSIQEQSLSYSTPELLRRRRLLPAFFRSRPPAGRRGCEKFSRLGSLCICSNSRRFHKEPTFALVSRLLAWLAAHCVTADCHTLLIGTSRAVSTERCKGSLHSFVMHNRSR